MPASCTHGHCLFWFCPLLHVETLGGQETTPRQRIREQIKWMCEALDLVRGILRTIPVNKVPLSRDLLIDALNKVLSLSLSLDDL